MGARRTVSTWASVCVLMTALLGACGGAQPAETKPGAAMAPFLAGTPEGTRYTYVCPEGLSFDVVAYAPGEHRLTLVLPDRTVEMRQEASAGSVRFSNGDLLFMATGTTGMVHSGSAMLYGGCTLKL